MPEVFVKFVFEFEAFSYIRMGLSLAKQLICCLRKCSLFYFWVSCLCTFNPLPLLLKWVTTLTGTTYRNMENRKSCRTTYMVRIKESERRPFFKFLDGIMFCTIHTRQMKLWQKWRNRNNKLLSVLETTAVS